MAIAICSDCNKEVSDSLLSCPHCGKLRQPTYTLQSLSYQISNKDNITEPEAIFFFNKSRELFINELIKFKINKETVTDEIILSKINEMKPLRDMLLDFFEESIKKNLPVEDFAVNIIESIKNEVAVTATNTSDTILGINYFIHFDFLIWELFICMITLLFHYEQFDTIYSLVFKKYRFYKVHYANSTAETVEFTRIKPNIDSLEVVMTNTDCNNNFYLPLIREKHPIITQKTFVYTDIMLYQLSIAFSKLDISHFKLLSIWFPKTYFYAKDRELQWIKLKSNKYCKKILPLFGVDKIEELKSIIEKLNSDLFDGTFYCNTLPNYSLTSHYFNVNEIGSEI